MNNVKATQTGNGNLGVDKGKLRIAVTSEITSYPVADATISISYTGVPENTLEKLQTDSSGQTEEIELAAPPIEYSLNQESDRQPYSEYTLNIEAEGFEPISISGTEILADVTAIHGTASPVCPVGFFHNNLQSAGPFFSRHCISPQHRQTVPYKLLSDSHSYNKCSIALCPDLHFLLQNPVCYEPVNRLRSCH